ncbi:EME1 endonuclease, partial [Amia calva]|nr:EME1 endonuclease [Amia calva]
MGGSRLNPDGNSDSDSDSEDLPVYGFLQSRPAPGGRTGHHNSQRADLVVLDSSDSEAAGPPPAACAALPRAMAHDVTMISSDSEEEAVYMPLLERLKGRLGAHSTSQSAASSVQPKQDPVSGPEKAKKPLKVVVPNLPTLPQTEQHDSALRQASVWDFSDSEGENEAPCSKDSRSDLGSLTSQKPCLPTCPEIGDHGFSPSRKKTAKRRQASVEAAREDVLDGRGDRERQKAERESRKQELERQKAERKALADAVKALRPEECIKHMVVTIDPALLQLEGGGDLLSSLQVLGCSCAIEKQSVPRSVTWARRLPNSQGGESRRVLEAHVVIQVPVEDFVHMVHSYSQAQRGACSDSGPTLFSWTRSVVEDSPGRSPSLAVIDLERYFRSQKSQSQKKYREAVLGEGQKEGARKRKKRKEEGEQLPEISRVDVEEALVDLQLHTDVQVSFLATWKDFSEYIAMSTKAVAEAPFKRERDQTSFSFYLESEWSGGHKVERSGKGLVQVWKRQIQQLNRVSPDMASAILAAYPSPQLLAKAYRKCSSDREKQNLLSEILIRRGEGVTSTSRRVGPELSKRVCLLMTSLDPDLSLESTG